VFAAFLILIFSICAAPFTLFVDGNIVSGVEAGLMAVATSLVAGSCTPADTRTLLKLSRVVLLFSAIPALWMIIQVLPLGYVGLANPVWQSVQSTLGLTIGGGIGIDTGAELLALCQYLSAAAILFVSMAVALDRSRADGVLFALLTATILICLPTADLLSWLLGASDESVDIGTIGNVGAIGVLLATAAAARTFERWQSSRGGSKSQLVPSLATCLVALAICGSAVTMHWTNNLAFGLAFALIVFLAVMAVRYLQVGFWGASTIAITLLTVSIVLIWIQLGNRAFDPMLAYSDDASLVALTKRVLSDATWTGSGAGSFGAVSNVYGDSADTLIGAKAPTAAAKIAIELGRPMPWTITIMMLLAIAGLLRGALRRRRDAFYPALGAGCLIAILILAFGNAGIFTPAVSIIAASTIGLGLAQSIGRTTH
jgi:hypothetical protein